MHGGTRRGGVPGRNRIHQRPMPGRMHPVGDRRVDDLLVHVRHHLDDAAVEFDDLVRAQPLDPGFLEPDGAGGGIVEHHAQAGYVMGEALFDGLETAVKRMRREIDDARGEA